MKKTGKENVVKKTGKENVSLSGNGRIIAGKLRDAGAADVGEREIQAIEREYTPRATGPVPGYLASIPPEHYLAWLEQHRAGIAAAERQQQAAEAAKAEAAERAAAEAALPVCDHGIRGGATPLRAGMPLRCVGCRRGLADDGEAFTPASRDVIEEARRKLAGMRGTVRTALGSRSA